MPAHKETKILPYSAKQMFNLVMDIEKYPEFLPWCSFAKVTKIIDENNLNADLIIDFKGFSQKYSSDVRSTKIGDNELEINVAAIDGPFKNLINNWRFKNIIDGCQVEFFIDFEFKSIILEKMIGLIFARATDKMIEAFEQRAKFIYK